MHTDTYTDRDIDTDIDTDNTHRHTLNPGKAHIWIPLGHGISLYLF